MNGLEKRFRQCAINALNIWEAITRVLKLLREGKTLPFGQRIRISFTPLLNCFSQTSSWLSDRVASLQSIRTDRHRAIPSRAPSRFLRPFSQFRASVILGIALLLTVLTLCIVFGLILQNRSTPSTISLSPQADLHPDYGMRRFWRTTPDNLLGISEVIASITALVFVAMVFGLELYANRLGQAYFLLPYLARHYQMMLTITVALTTIASNALVSLVSSLWIPMAAPPMAVIDCLLVPAVVYLTLRLCHRMILAVSFRFLHATLRPELTDEYTDAIDEEARSCLLQDQFDLVCQEFGIDRKLFIRASKDNLSFRIGTGNIADLNITELSRLKHKIECIAPGISLAITGGPGGRLFADRYLCLSRAKDSTTPLAVLETKSFQKQLKRRLLKTFRFSGPQEKEIAGTVEQLGKVLVNCSSRGPSVDDFREFLELHSELIGINLQHPMRDTVIGDNGWSLALFIDTSDYYEMARRIVSSDDQDKIVILMDHAASILLSAARSMHSNSLRIPGEILNYLYWRAVSKPAIADAASEKLDRVMDPAGMVVKGFQSYSIGEATSDSLPLIKRMLAWIIEAIAFAVEANRVQDSMYFYDRLGMKYDDPWEIVSREKDPQQTIGYLKLYARIIIFGWCVRLIRQGKNIEAATQTAKRACSGIMHRQPLITVWEGLEQASNGGGLIDPHSWELRSVKIRTGISFSRDREDWIREGFWAILLGDPSNFQDIELVRKRNTPEDIPLDGYLEAQCKSFLDCEAIREKVLAIKTEDVPARIASVKDLFASKRKANRLAELKTVIESDVSDEQVRLLSLEVKKQLAQRRLWPQLLKQLGTKDNDQHNILYPEVKISCHLAKDPLIPGGSSVSNYSGFIADHLARSEAQTICSAIEDTSIECCRLADLRSIEDGIRACISHLEKSGFKADIVIVPHDPQFSASLFKMPLWRIPKTPGIPGFYIGRWGQCEILSYPYSDPKAIVVMDSNAFVAYSSTNLESIDLSIVDKLEKENAMLLKKAEAAKDDAEIPDTTDVQVRAELRLAHIAGIAVKEASVTLVLDLTQVGYGMIPGDIVYHRPHCVQIEGKNAQFSLHRALDGEEERRPCEVCLPNDWYEDLRRSCDPLEPCLPLHSFFAPPRTYR